jgi:hypothetical protein
MPGRQSGEWNIPEQVHGVTRLRVTSVWYRVDFYTYPLPKGIRLMVLIKHSLFDTWHVER